MPPGCDILDLENMSDHDLALRRIRKLEAEIAVSGGKDDAHATRRASIGAEYQRLGLADQAAHWFLEAARYAEFSEQGLMALAHAKAAAAIAPESLVVRREYGRLWKKYGPPGVPDPVR